MLLSTGRFFNETDGGPGGATAPAQFQLGEWSVADDGTAGDITISITALPSNGGSAITDLAYQIDGGSWTSLGGTTTGDYPLSGFTDNVEVDVAIRAVNAIGNGTASLTKAVVSTALVTEYNTATEMTHDWANLTGWTTSGVQVNSNRLYGVAGANPSATGKAFAVAAGDTVKVTAEIVVNGAGSGTQYVGINFGGANDGVNASLPNFIGIGIATGNRRPNFFVGANFTGVTTGSQNIGGDLSLTGTWRAIVIADDENISLVLRKQDGSKEYTAQIARSAAPNSGAVTSVIVWNGDTNGTSGHYVKAIGARKSLTPFVTKTNAAGTIDGNTGLVLYRNVADLWRIHLPAGLDGETPAPVCIYFPQATTGVAGSPVDEARALNVDQALDTGGYIVLSASDNGDQWGNQDSLDNFRDLLDWVRARVYCGPVVLLGISGGAMTSWNAILRGDIQGAVAIAGICPVCDLDNMEANATYTASIRAAYGAADHAEYVTNSAGFNPVDSANLANFTGKGVKFYAASSGDTTVPNASHVDVFEPMVDDFAAASTVDLSGTSHLDTEQFQGTDLVTFFDTYV